ncbi:calmodulin-like protein 3 [Lingula anatina]|uniref:Calmodulin-like protein 3 n=1 Tax=Lingula anatina TaxID=7574 RepID=A0A1S3K902_LINAN|nr:calmodulin-like protein 3 [Lingula anatina]|eukprot:XP_013419098.1 calmodulin-like protein 3 [Lingula anatina]
MPQRKLPKEVQAMFDKYTQKNIRRLKKEQAITMLTTEFGLTAEQAENMFKTFDSDGNGSLSMWEFQQFYTIVGSSVGELLAKFNEMDKDGSGAIDPEEARAGFKSLMTKTGRNLTEKEVDFFIKTTSSEDGQVDIGKFGHLLYRLKFFEGAPSETQKLKKAAKEAEEEEAKA